MKNYTPQSKLRLDEFNILAFLLNKIHKKDTYTYSKYAWQLYMKNIYWLITLTSSSKTKGGNLTRYLFSSVCKNQAIKS